MDKDLALDLLITRRYDELAGRARRLLYGERVNHTLQTSALVHEAYLRMRKLYQIDWQEHARFIPVAVGVMRRVLIDHARGNRAGKRGGDHERVPLDENAIAANASVDMLDLDRALTRLEDHDPIQTRIVEHRFFGGLTIDQTAVVLDMSPATVKRKWALAQAWLYRELHGDMDGALANTHCRT